MAVRFLVLLVFLALVADRCVVVELIGETKNQLLAAIVVSATCITFMTDSAIAGALCAAFRACRHTGAVLIVWLLTFLAGLASKLCATHLEPSNDKLGVTIPRTPV